MGRALSTDLRARLIRVCNEEGLSARQAAARFGVSVSTAIRWIAKSRLGQFGPGRVGRRSGSSLDEHGSFLLGMIEEQKDITLNEMVARLVDEKAFKISHSALSVWLRRGGFTYKKRPHMHWSKIARIS